MSVPNLAYVPVQLHQTGLYDLRNHAQSEAFVDTVVATCHGIDPNFVHLIKKPGQTDVHDHGEDSMLYLLPNNQALAIDFIGGAGGSNPQPGWIVGSHVYTHADGHDPNDHGIQEGTAPPSEPVYPPYEALGGDDGGKKITRQLEADYKRSQRAHGVPAGQETGLDGDCGAWQQRVSYDFLTGRIAPVEAAIAAHRGGWCAALGIPVE